MKPKSKRTALRIRLKKALIAAGLERMHIVTEPPAEWLRRALHELASWVRVLTA